MNKEAKGEATHSKAISVFDFSVILGKKNLDKMMAYLPKNTVLHVRNVEGRTDITVLRKNASKVIKRVSDFFYDKSIKRFTSDGQVKFCSVFSGVFSQGFLKKVGIVDTKRGMVFSGCEKKYLKQFEPVLPPEDEAFREWDKEIDQMLAEQIEKKQIKAKKWLELTTPVLRNPGITGSV